MYQNTHAFTSQGGRGSNPLFVRHACRPFN